MRIQFPLLPREIEEVCRLCPGFRGDPSSLEDVKKFVLFYFLSARFNNMLDHHVVVYNDDICCLRFWLQRHPFIFTLPQIFSFPTLKNVKLSGGTLPSTYITTSQWQSIQTTSESFSRYFISCFATFC